MPNIRNFAILSHIDHGKSTLADRLLEFTETIPKEKMRPQFLDMMDLEREKGITIKMRPVRMYWKDKENGQDYILNLIDTPGHVDFGYEVSRSLAAVEGIVLLVDVTKGIQAQTIGNLELAKQQNLVIIPAVNKIDMSNARTEETVLELGSLLEIDPSEIIRISAKLGTNVEQIIEAIIKKVPPPSVKIGNNREIPPRALIFDSKFDSFKGIIAYVRIVEGEISQGEKIYLMATKTEGDAKEVGFFRPDLSPQQKISAGEIGYIATGIKEAGRVRVGDTITMQGLINQGISVQPLTGYKEPLSVVFASLYPENPDDFDLLKDGLSKLHLNDAALTFELESKQALGRGFRCGFLGTLHAEIVSERLRREFGLNLVLTTPQVLYKVIYKNGKESFIFSSSDWPDPSQVEAMQEPWVKLEVMTPISYLGGVMELIKSISGNYIDTKHFGSGKSLMIYEVPLREIVVGFYDNLKSITQGYASMNYKVLEFRSADLVKLDILVAGKKEEALSAIVPREKAFNEGQIIVKKLKELLPAQLFSVALQAVLYGKIIARETIRAKGRDVTAPLYGGDYTRKRKLLEQQKKGKKELKEKGEVRIPPKVFLEMLRK